MFPEKHQAIDYAECRANFRSGEIRILDSTGKIERTIAFDEAHQMLWLQSGGGAIRDTLQLHTDQETIDCVRDFVVPQPTERQRIGNQIDAPCRVESV